MTELPPLPEPAFRLRWNGEQARYTVSKPNIDSQDCYTADQLRAYAAEAVRVALEQAARIAETPFTGEQDDITMQAKDRAAAAIRALKGTP